MQHPPSCPACQGDRRAGQYLCLGCWITLPTPTRKALNRRDELRVERLQLLLQALKTTPLRSIQIR